VTHATSSPSSRRTALAACAGRTRSAPGAGGDGRGRGWALRIPAFWLRAAGRTCRCRRYARRWRTTCWRLFCQLAVSATINRCYLCLPLGGLRSTLLQNCFQARGGAQGKHARPVLPLPSRHACRHVLTGGFGRYPHAAAARRKSLVALHWRRRNHRRRFRYCVSAHCDSTVPRLRLSLCISAWPWRNSSSTAGGVKAERTRLNGACGSVEYGSPRRRGCWNALAS